MNHKKNFYILIISVFLFSFSSYADKPMQILEKANEAYSNNEFKHAVELYEKIIEKGFESSELYYNLGNAYFKSDKIAKAILNYERAKRLNPSDKNIIFNLRVAQSRTVDRIEPVPKLFYEQWWNNILSSQSERGWAITSIIFAFLFFVTAGLFFYISRKGLKKLLFIFAIIFLITTTLSLVFAQKQYNKLVEQTEAIVFTPRLTAKSAPSASSTDLFVIHQGTKVEITQKVNDWYEIRLPNGNVGWISKESVEII